MFALVDGNNFYASCHRIFRPDLRTTPIIVLSNRDGNVVARSPEAKQLGIKMGQPFFEVKGQHSELVTFSSNYELYGDISSRLMSVLTHFGPDVEVYSIDEAFLYLEEYWGLYPSYLDLGRDVKSKILQWLHLPVGVGIAPTKTLAKLESHRQGVCVLQSSSEIEEALSTFPVDELWGVGSRYARKLKAQGITTAAQLRAVPDDWIAQVMTVNGLRLVHELRGFPCRMLEVNPPPKKAICSAPSFGQVNPSPEQVEDALTSHLSRACEKLRRQSSLCGAITVFLHTNKYRRTPGNFQPAKQYNNSITVQLPHPTSATPELLRYALAGLRGIFRFGFHYAKVGVILSDLVPDHYRQKGVFVEGPNEKMLQLGKVVDRINRRYGQDKLRLASQLYNPEWPMKPQYVSPRYTTRWEEILTVN